MSNPLIENYFEAEEAIVERLGGIAGIKKIYTPFDVSGAIESSQASPAIHIIYMGDRIDGDDGQKAGSGASRVVHQQWLIVLAVRTAAAQLQHTTQIRIDAGKLIPLILNALQGWQPVPWVRPLVRIAGPQVGYSSSFSYFPFAFEGRVFT